MTKAEGKPKIRIGMHPKVVGIRSIDETTFGREQFHSFVFRPDQDVLDELEFAPVGARSPIVAMMLS